MKNRILFLAGIFVFLITSPTVIGQKTPFSVKARSVKSANLSGFKPKPVQPISGFTATSNGRGMQSSAFRPVSHPLPPLTPTKSFFSAKHFGPSGQLIFLSGKIPNGIRIDLKSSAAIQAASMEYLEAIQSDLRIKNVQDEFTITEQKRDELGICHIKMQQIYQGTPVYGGEIYLHSAGNQIGLFNGNPYPTPTLIDATPSISQFQAQLVSTMDVSARTAYHDLEPGEKAALNYNGPRCELVIYPKDRDPRQEYLAWHLTIRPNFLERWEYFIDAKTGSIIHFFNNTPTDGDVTSTGPDLNGVNRTIHAYLQSGNYLMVDVSRPMYNPQNQDGTMRVFDANYTCASVQGFNPAICSSPSNSWGPKVISSQYNAGVTYEYYRTTHNKNSWNDKGGSIFSVINATESDGSGMDNAFWNGVCIIYGNGNTLFKPLAGALDVSAHELGHAFDEGSANLEYQTQSGAMNEAFADISGSLVERLNWQIGEGIVKPGQFPAGCLRDMSNPHNGGNAVGDPGYQPANVSEMYTGSQDNGGVHINSGIINFAFYKYASAIGKDKGELTFFRALFHYLTRSSQFIDCRLAVVQSAKDLYGDGSAEMNAAKTAFDQVGIMDGTGGNYQNQLPVNPGQDYILSHDMDPGATHSLYISPTTATTFQPISQTVLLNKPSIIDNGSVVVFVGTDKMIHAINLNSPWQENIIQNEAIWSNVAISKDGTKIAAVTEYQDSAIWIYSYQKQTWIKAHLFNPTTQQGVVTNNVMYADALEWDYSGEFVMYDAYNQMNSSSTGQNVDYWDISFLQAWNNAAADWGSGEIFKLVTGIPEGISIGNPSLSKNSPAICAFDYYDGNNNVVSVWASNLETGDFASIFNNGTTLSYPNYSKMDDKIIFSATNNSIPVIGEIDMSPDKIHPASSNAYVLIEYAKWGVWFTQGVRSLGIPEAENQTGFLIYPNPTHGKVSLSFDKPVIGPFIIEVYDSRGVLVYDSQYIANDKVTVDLSLLNGGLYLLKITGNGFSATRKIVISR